MLAALKTHDGNPLDLTLTTNASLLSRKAQALKAAGLQRITVSLDSLDEAVFRVLSQSLVFRFCSKNQTLRQNQLTSYRHTDWQTLTMIANCGNFTASNPWSRR